jgi:hypothetical protein
MNGSKKYCFPAMLCPVPFMVSPHNYGKKDALTCGREKQAGKYL